MLTTWPPPPWPYLTVCSLYLRLNVCTIFLIMAQTRPLFRLFSSFSHPKLHINWKSLDVVLRIFVGLFFRYLAHFFAFGQIFIIVNGRKLNIWSHWLQSLWSGLPNERVRFYLFQVWSSFTLSTFVRSLKVSKL